MSTPNEQMSPNPAGPEKQMKQQSEFQKFMRSHTARFLIVGFLTLVLCIPLAQINWLIQERKMRQEEVTEQLTTEWGNEIVYYGMVLKIPVTKLVQVTDTDEKGNVVTHTEMETSAAYFYPEQQKDEADVNASEKYRGIFRSAVFQANMTGNAVFNVQKIASANKSQKLDWSKAQLCLVTNTAARFNELNGISVDGKLLPVESQGALSHDQDITLSSTAPFALDTSKELLTVQSKTTINGSQVLLYKPLAVRSTLHMKSNWSDPAFAGTSLPNTNQTTITEKGFEASWTGMKITNQSGRINTGIQSQKFSEVRFIRPVDHYQLNERTVKYGVLVLVLTFAVFFLIQVVGKVDIHPLHYFMIGLALLLFYSLLLSFSEQIGFIPAYIVAASAIILVIVWYARSVLKSMKFAVMSGLSLTLLYAFLLVIVNLEVYALIVGSIGLLLVLMAIMSITRKFNFDGNASE